MPSNQKQKRIIIANWKMNPSSLEEAEELFSDIAKSVSGIKKTEIVICPPTLYVERLKKISKKISLGAQDSFWVDSGAFTGEISAPMLQNAGAKYVILGHSERRALGETSVEVNKKIKAAISSGITPILCVGELQRDENHEYFNFVKTQLLECLDGIPKNLLYKVVIAYEPIWAISTSLNRRDATSLDSREMAIFIRKIISDKLGIKMKMPRVIYGGSVNEKDAPDFIKNGGVDGLLVGRNSLNAKKFSEIVKIAEHEIN